MKLKHLILAALMVAFLIPAGVFAVEDDNEEPTESTTAETTAEESSEEATEPEETEAEDEEKDSFKLTVKVYNVPEDFELIKELSAVYELKNQLGVPDAIVLHLEKVIEKSDFVVAIDALGRKWIEIDDCDVSIYVRPRVKELQIVHHLFDCSGKEVATFLEHDFIDYLTELSDEDAHEIAKTRIQEMNAKGYIFKEARADIKAELPAGVTVKTLDGEDVTPDPKAPTVHLFYIEEGCPAAEADKVIEEKVDAATVSAEVQQTLPATGDRSVLFVLSGAAMLGIAIWIFRHRR